MNPRIPADYHEVGRWLGNFATVHGKREDSRAQAVVRSHEKDEGRSYELRMVLGPVTGPSVPTPAIELSFSDVAQGRGGFAWCEALAARIRETVRALKAQSRPGETRSA